MIASNRISAERWPANRLLALRRRDSAKEAQAVRDARAHGPGARCAARRPHAGGGARGVRARGAHALASLRAGLAARAAKSMRSPRGPRRACDVAGAGRAGPHVRGRRRSGGADRRRDGRDGNASSGHGRRAGPRALLGDLREYTGRLGALFVAPLVRNEALDNDRLARILQMRGRIVQLRALIAGAIAPTLDDAMLSNDLPG